MCIFIGTSETHYHCAKRAQKDRSRCLFYYMMILLYFDFKRLGTAQLTEFILDNSCEGSMHTCSTMMSIFDFFMPLY